MTNRWGLSRDSLEPGAVTRIYLDEAGNFVPQVSGQSLFSLVLALVVPSSIETKLFR